MSSSLPNVAARVKNITDVADDLTRELVRARMPATSAIFELVAFIRTEAEAIIVDLATPGPPRP